MTPDDGQALAPAAVPAPGRFAGKLEAVRSRRVFGWALPLAPGAPKARVTILVDGRKAGEVMAETPRPDLIAHQIGDGAHAFVLDIAPALVTRGVRVTIRALVGEPATDLPGSPMEYDQPADGKAERWDGGCLVGWAHGPGFGAARVRLLRGTALLIAWPADLPRRDLVAKSVGRGAHGFRLPLPEGLLDVLAELSLEIEGSGVRLKLPPADAGAAPRPASAFRALPEGRHETATEARLALLQSLRRAAQRPLARGMATLSAAVLQGLLNRLSAAENALAELDALADIIEARAEDIEPPEPLRSTAAGARAGAAERATHALLRAAPGLAAAALLSAVEQRLVAPYRNAGAAERARVEAMLLRHGGVPLLRAIAKAFRAGDFLRLPAVAYGRSLEILPAIPTPSAVRYFSTIQSWQRVMAAPPPLPAPAVQPGRRGRRVLYALWRSIPYDTNGYATRSHYLLRGLRAVGEEVLAVTRLGYPWDAEQKLAAAAQFEVVDDIAYLHLGGAEANRNTMTLDGYVEECAQRLAQVAVAQGVGIIHCASNWMAALPALRAARLAGLPFCYEMRGLWEVTRASYMPGYPRTEHFDLFKRMEAYVAGQADLVFTITRQLRQEMGLRGVDTAKVLLAPNGCEVARFEPQTRDPALARELGIGGQLVFGFIGSFARYEGLLDLCRAAVALHGRGLDFRVLIVGDGPAARDVAAFCAAHDHGGKILLLGSVPFTEVPRYYSLVDVAVFPRNSVEITEMISPLKPFEAMAMAKPVIGSDVAAIAEIIDHGRTGWLFRKDDVGALVDLLAGLIAAPESIPETGGRAREFVLAQHDWAMVAQRITGGWDRLRAGPGG
jgi:glycosyltransferase involved in cell wall biosynthesis